MAQRGKKRSVRGSDVEEDMVTVGDIAVAQKYGGVERLIKGKPL